MKRLRFRFGYFTLNSIRPPRPPNLNVAEWKLRLVTKRNPKVTTLKFKRRAGVACGISVGSIILPSVRSIELVDGFFITLDAFEITKHI